MGFLLQAVAGVLVVGGSMLGISRFAYARATGAYRARAFDVRVVPLGREIVARLAACVAPAIVLFVLFWLSFMCAGTSVVSNEVNVTDGPARAAGVRDGDRIVAVDGRPTPTWETVQAELKSRHHSGVEEQAALARELSIQRAGVSLKINVQPNAEGKVRIVAAAHSEPIGPLAAAERAGRASLELARGFSSIFLPKEQADFRGPVGIVRETRDQPGAAATFYFMAVLAGRYLLVFFVAHCLDALTLRLFSSLNPGADAEADDARKRAWRVARMRQLLLAGFGGFVALTALVSITRPELEVFVALEALFLPVLLPATWVLARETSGRALAVLSVIAVGVPLFNLLLLWWLSVSANTFMRNRGLIPAGLRVSLSSAA